MANPSLTRPAAAAVGLTLLLGGCSAATAEQGAPVARATQAGPDFPEGPGPDDRPDPAVSGEPVPTLPPGDPGAGSGADAGSGDDGPGRGDGHSDDGHSDDGQPAGGHQPVTSVPDAALLDPATVAALAGGSWAPDRPGGERCVTAAPEGATASRASALLAAEGRLAQTVSAHGSAQAARAAVDELARRLAGCGFAVEGDPRLGEASTQLTRAGGTGQEVALVLAVEGVSVVLVGGGSPAAPEVWSALADLALGTACAAGRHGCH